MAADRLSGETKTEMRNISRPFQKCPNDEATKVHKNAGCDAASTQHSTLLDPRRQVGNAEANSPINTIEVGSGTALPVSEPPLPGGLPKLARQVLYPAG